MTQKIIHLIGVASGIGAPNHGCSLGPLILQESNFLKQANLEIQWEPMFYSHLSESGLAALESIAKLNARVAELTYQLTQQQQFFGIIGGDQSCSIGTWSGVANAKEKEGPVGLIWIDAHMDSHTFKTTESGQIHGMPLACLLGYGEPALRGIMSSNAKLKPAHVYLIGVRSFEKGEAELLKKLNVKIFYMNDIKQQGLENVFKQALNNVRHNTIGYGISIDLDAIDPHDAPGVCSLEPDGIHKQELLKALTQTNNDEKLIGFEIVEFNPNLDKQQKTEKLIVELISAITRNNNAINHKT